MLKPPTRVALVWPGGLDPRRVLPLAYACLAANTPRELCEFRLFDLALGAPAPERLEAELAAFAPEIVGLSCFAMNFPQALAAARAAKRAVPGAAVIAGGQHPSSWPEGVLANPEVDFVLKGEGERAFAAFLEQWRSPAPDWGRVPGLARRGQAGLADLAPAMVEDLDSLALPDYGFINFREYLRRGYRVYSDSRPGAPLQTTRGCPYACAFCCGPAVSGPRLRRFSAAYAVRWLETLNREYGVLWFNLIDDNFTFHPEAAKEFCREVLKLRIPGLRFGTPNGVRAQHGDPELWRLMKYAGWDHFTVAPESGSERVLGLMKKDLRPAQIEAAVKEMRAAGLPVCGFFIVGYPGETREDLARTMRMVKLFDLVEMFVFQPLPGSPVFRELFAAGRLSADFVPAVDDFSSGERSWEPEPPPGVNYYRAVFLARLGTALRHPLTALRHLRHLDLPAAAGKLLRQAAAALAGRRAKA